MEQEKEGVSIGEIFRTIFSQKWLALILMLAITLGGTLGLIFGYNSQSSYYVSTFSVGFPGSDNVIPLYPDNTPFNYRDITSRANLSTIKNLDERFKNIDVNGMYAQSALSISRTDIELSSVQTETIYTIRVKVKYFDNEAQAEAFIDALAQTPLRYVQSLAVEQDLFLRDYDKTNFYEDKVELLTNQVEYLNQSLSELLQLTGGNIKNDCVRLLTQLSVYTQQLNTAIGEMRQNLYVHNGEEVRTNYSSLLITLEAQHTSKLRELELLFGKIQSGDPTVDTIQTSARIESLAAEIAEIENEITVYGAYIAPEAIMIESAEFAQTLANLNSQLKIITDSYEQNLERYYNVSSLVAYEGATKVVGDLSIVMCVLISLVAGAIVAAVTAYSVGYAKLKKNKTGDKEDNKQTI